MKIYLRKKKQKLLISIFVILLLSIVFIFIFVNNMVYMYIWLILLIPLSLSYPHYILKFENGKISYVLDSIISKKIIEQFEPTDIDTISIKQLENKYFAAVLILKNGTEIFLDSNPTKDKTIERIEKIKNEIKAIFPLLKILE